MLVFQSAPSHSVNRDLFALVEESIRNANSTVRLQDPEILHKYVEYGYLGLSEAAFQAYFDSYETIVCPPEVQVWVDRFSDRIQWKRASGILAGANRSFPEAKVAVMLDGPAHDHRSWFHELAHIVFRTIPEGTARALTCVASAAYPTVASPAIEGELCLKINSRFCAFNHGGPEGEDHEVLAILFAEFCSGFKLRPDVRRQLERIIDFYRL